MTRQGTVTISRKSAGFILKGMGCGTGWLGTNFEEGRKELEAAIEKHDSPEPDAIDATRMAMHTYVHMQQELQELRRYKEENEKIIENYRKMAEVFTSLPKLRGGRTIGESK